MDIGEPNECFIPPAFDHFDAGFNLRVTRFGSERDFWCGKN